MGKVDGGSFGLAEVDGGSFGLAKVDGGSSGLAKVDGGCLGLAKVEGGPQILAKIDGVVSRCLKESYQMSPTTRCCFVCFLRTDIYRYRDSKTVRYVRGIRTACASD